MNTNPHADPYMYEGKATTKHTAEPWHVAPTAPDTILADVKVGGCYSGHPEDFANAARIVACVNACAGMEDPAADMEYRIRMAYCEGFGRGSMNDVTDVTEAWEKSAAKTAWVN